MGGPKKKTSFGRRFKGKKHNASSRKPNDENELVEVLYIQLGLYKFKTIFKHLRNHKIGIARG